MKELTDNKTFVENLFYPSRRTVEMLKLNEELNEARKKLDTQERMLAYNHKLISEIMDEFEFSKSLSEQITSSLDINDVLKGIFSEFHEHMELTLFSVLIRGDISSEIRVVSNLTLSNKNLDDIKREMLKDYRRLTGIKLSLSSTVVTLIDMGESFGSNKRISFAESGAGNHFLSERLVSQGGDKGLMHLYSAKTFGECHRHVVSRSMSMIVKGINNAISHLEALELSTIDGLTGITNRRIFNESIDREYQRAVRYRSPLSFMLIDIDHFKNINDTMGHQAGDQVLCEVVDHIGKCIRNSDLLARYGGEEFAIILPETGSNNAIATAERIREYIDSNNFKIAGEDIHITVSIGSVTLEGDELKGEHEKGNTSSNMLGIADSRLYKAKELGRNKICCD